MLKKSIQKPGRMMLSAVLGLVTLLTVAGARAPESVAQGEYLVRLDLAAPGGLAALAEQGLSVYGEVFAADERVTLLLPAEAGLQARLAGQGYTIQVLDMQPGSAEYFLVEAQGDELQQVATLGRLIILDSQQAVLRSTAARAETLALLAVRWRPLRLHRLVAAGEPDMMLQSAAITPSPQVQQMVSQVSQSQLYNLVGGLSGEWPVTIDGSPYTLYTRYTWAATPITKATRYTRDFFLSLGLTTDYDYYFISGTERRNVVAEQVGVGQPSRIFLLTAHLDSTSNSPYSLAPGADDNASGSAAVMHIASILRNYQLDCTLRYVLFTGEEQGLYGSYYYAQDVYSQGQNIAGVLNLDMIAYNTPGSYPSLGLHTRSGVASDLAIANLFKDAVSAYQVGLYPAILQDGLSFSDHSSFWDFGYPAILAIEDWSDHTPDYHLTTDRLGTLDMWYYTEFTRAALATFAHMGCLREGRLSGSVIDTKTGLPLAGAVVQAQLDAAQSWQTTTKTDGTYQLSLIPGTYTVSASAQSHLTQTAAGVVVYNGQTTTRNFSLQPCTDFQNLNFTYTPVQPAVGQTVSFSASVTGSSPTYSWTFGDGSSGSGQFTSHAFTAPGGYQVTLTIPNACTPTTISKIVVVGFGFRWFAPLISVFR